MIAHISEVAVAEVVINDSARHSRANDEHGSDGAEGCEHYNEGHGADNRADDAEGGGENVQRAHSCLAVGVLELLVELGIVKGAEIHVASLVDYLHLYMIRHALARYGGNHTVEAAEYAVNEVIDEVCDKEEYHRAELIDKIVHKISALRNLTDKGGDLVEYIL